MKNRDENWLDDLPKFELDLKFQSDLIDQAMASLPANDRVINSKQRLAIWAPLALASSLVMGMLMGMNFDLSLFGVGTDPLLVYEDNIDNTALTFDTWIS